jgi:hypothetical protein
MKREDRFPSISWKPLIHSVKETDEILSKEK